MHSQEKITTQYSTAIPSTPHVPQVVVGAILVADNGCVLLARVTQYDGLYAIPGGHVMYGESLKDALRRETKEEVGLAITDARLMRVGESICSPQYKDGRQHLILIDYVCRFVGDILLDGLEISDAVWMLPAEALERNDLTIATRDTLSCYLTEQYGDREE